MPLETATHINQLVVTNPANSDGLNQADDHMRLIKSCLLTDVGSSLTNQNLTVPDGTSIAPSVGYAADATAGFYRKGAGQQGIVGSLLGTGSVDIGFLAMYAGSAVPNGYLVCDGQAVSRTTYAALYAAIGTTWGAGDGSTTFNVPGLNSRFPRHREVAGAAGAVGTLQANQNLTHTHTGSGTTATESATHYHAFSGNTGGMSANDPHTHSTNGTGLSSSTTGGGGFSIAAYGANTIGSTSIAHTHAYSGNTGTESATHTHTFSVTTDTGSAANGTEARPQSATVLFCIRAL